MLDKSIPYADITMLCPWERIKEIEPIELPEGYTYHMYAPGDEAEWARLETAVLEFSEYERALGWFNEYFQPAELRPKRVCFVCAPSGKIVATASAWMKIYPDSSRPMIAWVSTDPEYQGKKLGKAVLSKALSVHRELDAGQDVVLHTQTWSHTAVRMYYNFGFRMMKTGIEGLKNDFDNAIEGLKLKLDDEMIAKLIETAID